MTIDKSEASKTVHDAMVKSGATEAEATKAADAAAEHAQEHNDQVGYLHSVTVC